MKWQDLSERTRRYATRIAYTEGDEQLINASAICRDYGKDLDRFRCGWLSYDPVDELSYITGEPEAGVDDDGDVYVTKQLALILLKFCDIKFQLWSDLQVLRVIDGTFDRR